MTRGVILTRVTVTATATATWQFFDFLKNFKKKN